MRLLISAGCPMSGLHFGICIDDRSTHPLLDEYQNIDQDHHRALLVRVAVVFVLLRRLQGPATHLQSPKRRPVDGSHSLLVVLSLSLRARINLPKYLDMASQQQEIRLRSSAVDRSPVAESATATRARTTTFASSSSSSPGIPRSHSASSSSTVDTTDAMLPPPLPRSDSFTRGRSRASPSVSRHKNRLSLTLPVALQLADGTRLADSPAIMSASALASSVPQTPLETPASVATSPSNANEVIIAIAAQERRVLELKEELAQAEVELAKLKKQWASEEVYRKRSDSQREQLFGSSQASIDEDALVASRRSVELDRRKQILHGQTTPAQSRRKVMRGGHARTLSLLSPVRTESVFSLNEVTQADPIALPTVEQRTAQLTHPTLSKSSSWQPRSQQSVASVVGVPSIVEDFKLGFRAFVEDIRQITVGDEPVNGQSQRPLPTSIASARGQDTSKPNHDTTIHARTSSNEGSSTATSTSSQANRTPELKPKTGRGKQFSWTPLGFDSVDDTDWSNWDSPVSTKSARWSGSTVNSSGIDDIPEKEDEEDAKP